MEWRDFRVSTQEHKGIMKEWECVRGRDAGQARRGGANRRPVPLVPGLMGHGAGTDIKFISTAGMGMGFRWYLPYLRQAPPQDMYKFWDFGYLFEILVMCLFETLDMCLFETLDM